MRNPIYDLSNRAYDQLKGSNPEKFQFLITHYYWKEDKYCKEYIAQFSGAAVIFEKSVFQEDLKTCTYPFKKGTGNALTALPPWSCEQILILMVWAQLLILVSEKHSHSVGCNALPSAFPHYLSFKVPLKHQKVEVSNAIIPWLAAIIFCYNIQYILSNYASNHWFEISIRLRGDTHLQRDKDNNFVPGIDKLFTAPQIKGNISLKNRYTITAITKHLPHPDQGGMQTLKWLEWSSVWAQNTSFKGKKLLCYLLCSSGIRTFKS